jgi:apolipoprotein N-acyltransferase
MDWAKEANARPLATAYLVGFLAWLIGVVWILSNQATGGAVAGMVVGIILFAIGQALISVVAFTLRKNFQTSKTASSFSQAWQRLSVGLEIPPALRLLFAR